MKKHTLSHIGRASRASGRARTSWLLYIDTECPVGPHDGSESGERPASVCSKGMGGGGWPKRR